jgi:hypothetical protein
MMKIKTNRGVLLLALGVLIGMGVSSAVHSLRSSATVLAQAPAPDLATMQADIAHLKEVVPSQSHAMTDVGYQFANLWFAGKQKNWPLADFFLNESRQHITWTIRMRPVRKDTEGNPVDLKAIFDTISNGPLKTLTQSIQDKNDAEFADAYKKMLDGCYGCHVASGKPFLRLVIPQVPPQTIVSFGSGGEKSK